MEQLYRIYVRCESQYDLNVPDIICTKEALDDFLEKFKKGILDNDVYEGKVDDVIYEENSITLDGGWDLIEIHWEKYKPKVVTKFGDLLEIAWNTGGYDDTYLNIEIDEKYD